MKVGNNIDESAMIMEGILNGAKSENYVLRYPYPHGISQVTSVS